ncbi:Uncharacterized protein FKW44_008835 [Caligus rogercresseyi]|uniref:Uncharacterized protein n=1 Tax=Caligus rogercresseyi TaxID=217165 RepID=A0A7T8QUK1_CALRO|nr:Uncharacterized protein FKW44_008835 [Caligus rogercresseyi]
MSDLSPGDPPDNISGRTYLKRRDYANVVKNKKYNDEEIRMNLNGSFKWESFVLTCENSNGECFKTDNLKHINVYDLAVLYGFREEEIAGANPRFGLGQACFYTRCPVDVRTRLNDLKRSFTMKVLNHEGVLVDAVFKLKGIDKVVVDGKKKVTVTLINTFKRVDEASMVKWMGKWGEVLNHYPKKNPVNKTAEEKYSNYREIWRDSDYVIEIITDPSTLPQIIAFKGNLVRLKFSGSKIQCQRCFNFGHLKYYCNEQRVRTFDYEKTLIKTLEDRTNNVIGESNNVVVSKTVPQAEIVLTSKESDKSSSSNNSSHPTILVTGDSNTTEVTSEVRNVKNDLALEILDASSDEATPFDTINSAPVTREISSIAVDVPLVGVSSGSPIEIVKSSDLNQLDEEISSSTVVSSIAASERSPTINVNSSRLNPPSVTVSDMDNNKSIPLGPETSPSLTLAEENASLHNEKPIDKTKKPLKQRHEIQQILSSRTRSQSAGKRNRSDSILSPERVKNTGKRANCRE